jgi:MOSC domain-containing protein YiiM
MDMLKRMLRNGRTGFYFAATTEGEVAAGDVIEPIERVDEGLTVADVVRLYAVDAENQELLRRATHTSRLPDSWKDYFRKRLWDPDA